MEKNKNLTVTEDNWQSMIPLVQSTIRGFMICKDSHDANNFARSAKAYGVAFEEGFKSLFDECDAQTSEYILCHKLEIWLLDSYNKARVQKIDTRFFYELVDQLYYCLCSLQPEVSSTINQYWEFKLSVGFGDVNEAGILISSIYELEKGPQRFKQLALQNSCLQIKLTCFLK